VSARRWRVTGTRFSPIGSRSERLRALGRNSIAHDDDRHTERPRTLGTTQQSPDYHGHSERRRPGAGRRRTRVTRLSRPLRKPSPARFYPNSDHKRRLPTPRTPSHARYHPIVTRLLRPLRKPSPARHYATVTRLSRPLRTPSHARYHVPGTRLLRPLRKPSPARRRSLAALLASLRCLRSRDAERAGDPFHSHPPHRDRSHVLPSRFAPSRCSVAHPSHDAVSRSRRQNCATARQRAPVEISILARVE